MDSFGNLSAGALLEDNLVLDNVPVVVEVVIAKHREGQVLVTEVGGDVGIEEVGARPVCDNLGLSLRELWNNRARLIHHELSKILAAPGR